MPAQVFTNRLSHETSPYLRQHAHNPVDWYPWGAEALAKAKELDRPIFLSIGYSACHWCHVMEHESFEDEEIAKILNEHFISIKVDREERPDLDQIYMTAVQLLTRQGGWPMSMFLTPDLKPFYGGTYFPPDDRYGRPGFKRLLQHLVQAWQEKREVIEQQAGQLTGHIQQVMQLEPGAGELTPDILRQALGQLSRAYDPVHGGFGGAPKFPHAMELKLLLRVWKRFGDDDALEMSKKTLDHMAMGGMYDHLGGGFHRYSTDDRWLVPHFEKMLYDNALLTSAYVEAYQATKLPFYRQVIEETLEYVRREMTSPEGPFYSTQDADSEGVEGKFFVWSADEVLRVLGPDDCRFFAALYDVTDEGNWEGHNILNRGRSDELEARMLNMPVEELQRRAKECRQKLLEIRSRRVWPGRDEKILTAWNGLMIDAMAQAAQVLGNSQYASAAAKGADFILRKMRDAKGRLLRTYSTGGAPKLNAYLEDYTFLANALVSLYEATFESRWIEEALALTNVLVDQFWDASEGGFFYTGKDHEQLIARSKDPHDSSIPSGNSMAVTALLRLGKLTGRRDLRDKAERTLRLFRGLLDASPLAAGQMLIALEFYLGPVQEFAIVGDLSEAGTAQALRVIHETFLPNKVLAFKGRTGSDAKAEAILPLLAGKTSQGPVTTYICRDFACQAPLIGVDALRKALTGGTP